MSKISRKRDRFARVSSEVTLSIIVPVFNEAATVVESITNLNAALEKIPTISSFEIIIVESNSSDQSRNLVKQFQNRSNFVVVFEDRARGKGHAVREGLNFAKGQVISIFDADLEYDPQDFSKLLSPILAGGTSFVIGSRHSSEPMRVFDSKPGVARVMNFGHLIFTFLFNVTFGVNLKDPFTMYKVFRTECIQGISFYADRFDFDYELAGKIIRNGSIPIEIPVSYDSRDYSEGKKVRFIRDPITWLVALVRFRFQSLR